MRHDAKQALDDHQLSPVVHLMLLGVDQHLEAVFAPPASPRATISTARASGSVSTQSHQRSPSSRNTATISALGSEPFSLAGSPAKNPRKSKPSIEVSFCSS